MDKKDLKRSKKHVPSFKMPFNPKSHLKGKRCQLNPEIWYYDKKWLWVRINSIVVAYLFANGLAASILQKKVDLTECGRSLKPLAGLSAIVLLRNIKRSRCRNFFMHSASFWDYAGVMPGTCRRHAGVMPGSASFCIDWGSVCSVLHRLRAHTLESELIL